MPITHFRQTGAFEFMDTPRPTDDDLAAAGRGWTAAPARNPGLGRPRFHPVNDGHSLRARGSILHAVGDRARRRVINLDTGYQFAETLGCLGILEQYGIAVELVRQSRRYEREHGGPLYVHRPDQCCYDRKVLPLRRAVRGYAAWISAIRGDQTDHRKAAGVVHWDPKFNLVKVNPLLQWTKKDVWKFLVDHDVPYNPLHDQGYPSIGCWPCTAPVEDGGDERSGRWAGSKKKECGLHVIEHQGGSGRSSLLPAAI